MNNLEDRDVIVLAAHCEACGGEMKGAYPGAYPMRVSQAFIRLPFHCGLSPFCGGRIVFDLMGAPA